LTARSAARLTDLITHPIHAQHVFVEYTVKQTAAWEAQAREGRAWWVRLLSWSSRIGVVALMAISKAIIAMASQLNASEYGASRCISIVRVVPVV